MAPAPKRSSDPSGEQLNVALCYLPEEGVRWVSAAMRSIWSMTLTMTFGSPTASGRGAGRKAEGMRSKVPFDSSEMLESFGADQLAGAWACHLTVARL